jgi:hypothetical protein
VISVIQLICAQTQQEKVLTILYISALVVVLGMMVLDTIAGNIWKISKAMHWLLYVVFIVALVALTVLLVIAKRS